MSSTRIPARKTIATAKNTGVDRNGINILAVTFTDGTKATTQGTEFTTFTGEPTDHLIGAEVEVYGTTTTDRANRVSMAYYRTPRK